MLRRNANYAIGGMPSESAMLEAFIGGMPSESALLEAFIGGMPSESALREAFIGRIINGSECGRDQLGFGCDTVYQKLRCIQYNRVLNIINFKILFYNVLKCSIMF